MFKVKYVHSTMMLVRLDLNLIVSFQNKCEVSETVSTTTLTCTCVCTCMYALNIHVQHILQQSY